MAIKYIYIDDTFEKLEQGTINAIQAGKEIEIKFLKPQNWDVQIEELQKDIVDYDGVILDLRLNDNPNDEGKCVKYRGSSIAQELRTLAKEGVINRDFPIVLMSANNKIEESLDETSIDLFDVCVHKNDLGDNFTYEQFRKRLISLSNGYHFLEGVHKDISSILALDNADLLDFRFKETFNNILTFPNHVISRFITKNILEKPAFLINKLTLSAKLGVDSSSDEWEILSNTILAPCKYQGVFHDYFERWWMPKIESWWSNEISKDQDLRNLTAIERTKLIGEQYGLTTLKPLEKSALSKSDKFWTICKATNVPIDTIDGLLIANQDNFYPWQDKEYVSINEALRPTKIELWKDVATVEKNRLNKLKELYSNENQRVRK